MDFADSLLPVVLLAPLAALLASLLLPESGGRALARVGTVLALLAGLLLGAALPEAELLGAFDGWLRLDGLSGVFLLILLLGATARETLAPDGARASRLRLASLSLGIGALLAPTLIAAWACLALLCVSVAAEFGRGGRGATFLRRAGLGLGLSLLGLVILLWAALLANGSAEAPLSLEELSTGGARLDSSLLRGGALLALLGLGPLAGAWPGGSWIAELHATASAGERLLLSFQLGGVSLAVLLRFLGPYANAASPASLAPIALVLGGLTLLGVLWKARGASRDALLDEALPGLGAGLLLWGIGTGSLGGVQAGLFCWAAVSAGLGLVTAAREVSPRLTALGLGAALGLPPLVGALALWSLLLAGLEATPSGGILSGFFGDALSTGRHLLFGLWLVWLWWSALPHLVLGAARPGTAPLGRPRGIAMALFLAALLLPALYLPSGLDTLFDQAARLTLGE